MKFKNKLLVLWTFLLFIVPINIFAYSDYIIPGGENVGIEVNSNGVLVVGFYKVDDKFIARDSGFLVGDSIIKVNGKEIGSIDDMVSVIKENGNQDIKFTINRDKKEKEIILKENVDKDGVYKTGMYVKDKIIGIGTLTYIDPNTKIFGALGHEINEKTTAERFEIKDGKIFKSNVTGIERSESGSAGEKKAEYDTNTVYGKVDENTKSGIFGDYTDDLPNTSALKVASRDEVRTGEAIIRTVIDQNKVEEFKINIIKIDKTNETKNILFEVTDSSLLEKTGGVVQGMSGSPIIQNEMIIGAVTHVIVNDTTKGWRGLEIIFFLYTIYFLEHNKNGNILKINSVLDINCAIWKDED